MIDQSRQSRLLKLCSECFFDHVAPLVKSAIADEDMEKCCQCHELVDDNVGEALYFSLFLPKREMEQYDILLCDPHADVVWDWLDTYGSVPEDRNPSGSRGPVNNTSTEWQVPW